MPEALPSLRSVQRIICSNYKTFPEGYFKYDDLASHIKEHKASTALSIGEDATRVISRVDYDSKMDKCVGFVLPLDDNGLRLVDPFWLFLLRLWKICFSLFQKLSMHMFIWHSHCA